MDRLSMGARRCPRGRADPWSRVGVRWLSRSMESTLTLTRPRADGLADLAERALHTQASEVEALLREAEVHKLRIAYQWAIAHPALDACETPGGASLPSVL